MSSPASLRLGDVGAMARAVRRLPPADGDPVQHRRRLVAEFCRLLGSQFAKPWAAGQDGLSPRHLQTLQRLLEGDSEKEIAFRWGVSPNTVHVYVKGLYRHFGVSSRGELLARFVRRG